MTNLLPTSDDTIGPYFPPCFAARERLDLRTPFPGMNVAPAGTPIRIQVQMLDTFGQLAGGCSLIDVWQANAAGVLRRPENAADAAVDSYFEGFGRVISRDGTFEIDTVKPGAVKNGHSVRAPHFTLTFFCDGFNRLVSQFFFADEPLNAGDPLLLSLPSELRDRLVARRVDDVDGVTTYLLQVRFRGENETPFFDDLLS
jgi:protocatechuate 3,4-dioxygenase, alpha subunit